MSQLRSHRIGYRLCEPAIAHLDISKVPMKTRGEIEARHLRSHETL